MKGISICTVFRNEGDQVRKTIESCIGSATCDIDIVVVNDASDDNYDYSKLTRYPQVRYFVNEERLGSSVSKEKAVQLAKYDQILLIDAHMRFIGDDWCEVINKWLEYNPKLIYVLNTIGLTEDDQIKDLIHFCQYTGIDDDRNFIGKWATKPIDDNPEVTRVACVMGASYFFTKDYWNYLRGLEGLQLYGREEEFISIKSWGMGDGCAMIKNCKIAHLYRKKSPCAPITVFEVWHNILMISYTLLPPRMHNLIVERMIAKYSNIYQKVIQILDKDKIKELKTYFTAKGFSYSKYAEINSLVKKANYVKDEDLMTYADKVERETEEKHKND